MTLTELLETCTDPIKIKVGLQTYGQMIEASDLPDAEKNKLLGEVIYQLIAYT